MGDWKDFQLSRPTVQQVEAWYANGRQGIGWVTGAVSDNLEVLDFDHGGKPVWTEFQKRCHEQGIGELLDRIIAGYAEVTPRGDGIHLAYRCTGPVDGNLKLARRLATPDELEEDANPHRVIFETRGEGGYIVVAPSGGTVHPTGRPWVLRRGGVGSIATISPDERQALLDVARSFDELGEDDAPPATPVTADPLLAQLTPPAPRQPASSGGWVSDTVDDFNRRTTWPEILTPHGWVEGRPAAGVGYWVRPGKNPRDGHSATVNANGSDRFILWSSSVAIPGVDVAAGERAPNYDRFSVWAGYHHGGDRAAAATAANRAGYGPAWVEHEHVDVESLIAPTVGELVLPTVPLNLPDEFWGARPLFALIRCAAHARLGSADALLYAFLARFVAYLDHRIEIPPIVGTAGSMNLAVLIVGASGTGKSTSMGHSAELVSPHPMTDVADNRPLGTGEGLAELYMGEVEVEDEKGKKKKIREQVRWNAFVIGDEGGALNAMMERAGATLPDAIRTSWTGGTLGQSNASADRRRVLPTGQYRLGLVVGFQPELTEKFLASDQVAAGTPQRFLFASSDDEAMPDIDVDHPGPPKIPQLSPRDIGAHEVQVRGDVRIHLGIEQGIVAEVRANHRAKVRGQVAVEPLDAHEPLHRLKLAGVLAIVDGRLDVNREDWALAGTMWRTSCAVRDRCVAAVRAAQAREEAARVQRHANREMVAEAARRSVPAKVDNLAARMARWVHAQHDEGKLEDGAPRRALLARLKSEERQLAGAAIDHAIASGWLVETGDRPVRFTPGPSRPAS